MMMADCSGSASSSNNTLTMSTAHRMRRAGSGGLLSYHTDCSDDDLESSSHSHVLDRVKSDRMPVTKPEEDRRRRTIIVEKKNNSYGFTLQSYGIHYKKEQEIEMITYVDYVEYDGPAYRSGMREGDVILSINGADMEKADHKTLVAFIKGCDMRMRMVVLFEDCVRKVELHMRYIQLQTVLQGKMNELERTCLRERELLEGKWKTHSLPARKKATTSANVGAAADGGADDAAAISPNGDDGDGDVPVVSPFCRPALSTENVHQMGRHQRHPHAFAHQHQHHLQPLSAVIPPPAQFMLTYQYLDPHCRYVLRPSLLLSSSSGGGHHHHHHHHQQRQSQQQQHGGEYYVSKGNLKSPENPMTNFGSNESTDEILSDVHANTASQSEHHERHQHHHHHHHQQHHQSSTTAASVDANGQPQATAETNTTRATKSSGRHCHSSHSCNPCLGHRKEKTSSANGGAAGGDNVSLDAYDLASPCCDPHCVPTRRRTRHHKDHNHRHKHRDKDQKDQQRPQRPRSQSHAASPSMVHTTPVPPTSSSPHQQHGHYNEKCQNHRPRFYDITAGLASHCSLHSCTSSEIGGGDQQHYQSINGGMPASSAAGHCMHGAISGGGGAESSAASYSTSLSTDTLYWDPESQMGAGNSRQQSTKSRQSGGAVSGAYHPQTPTQTQQQYVHQQQQQQQQRYHHVHAGQVQPVSAYECHQTSAAAAAAAASGSTYMHAKPKSWDNLAMKGFGGYGFGYGYLDTVNQMALAGKPPPLGGNPGVAGGGVKLLPQQHPPAKLLFAQQQQQQQQQQRHSIPRKNPYGRYSTFSDVENYAPPPSQFVHSTITTTTITKSTENLIGGALNHSNTSLHSCDGCNEPAASGAGVAYVAQMQSMSAAGQQPQQPKHHDCRGYYSHLPRTRMGSTTAENGAAGGGSGGGSATGSATNSMSRTTAGGSAGGHVATVSEVTRL